MLKYAELVKLAEDPTKAPGDKKGLSDKEQAQLAYGVGGALLGGGGGYLLGRLIHGKGQSTLSKLLYALGGAGAGGALAYNYNPRTLADEADKINPPPPPKPEQPKPQEAGFFNLFDGVSSADALRSKARTWSGLLTLTKSLSNGAKRDINRVMGFLGKNNVKGLVKPDYKTVEPWNARADMYDKLVAMSRDTGKWSPEQLEAINTAKLHLESKGLASDLWKQLQGLVRREDVVTGYRNLPDVTMQEDFGFSGQPVTRPKLRINFKDTGTGMKAVLKDYFTKPGLWLRVKRTTGPAIKGGIAAGVGDTIGNFLGHAIFGPGETRAEQLGLR